MHVVDLNKVMFFSRENLAGGSEIIELFMVL